MVELEIAALLPRPLRLS